MEDPSPPSYTSSIGECSWALEDQNGTVEEDGEEIQSSYRGSLDKMWSLEDSLPIKRGLSEFYNGKSRSFTCLSDAIYAKDIIKPEDTYARKLKILRTQSIGSLDRHRSCYLRNSSAGVCKSNSFSNPGYLTSVAETNAESDTQDASFRLSASKNVMSMTDIPIAGSHEVTQIMLNTKNNQHQQDIIETSSAR
ncbi:hypothetical protein SUGI_0907540 [Cryptomeria japonica]|uniref:uncharacterized protein LOC131038321 n=1 Tax=Cryptomeria japonica TaxID=3369 RepID=UPI002414A2D7|nr:uncharacterized protein LOC131038321 [Cryptomeria japonica]GLJ43604.1 hypothetical protein SUGI_0907540 [Cryptomeria japonica]